MPRYQVPLLSRQDGRNFIWEYLLAHQDLPKNDSASTDAQLEFLSFCLQNFPFSRSQLFQDLYVLFKSNRKQGGYFVEFGATDGVSLSNTYLLESKYAWQGILAEPNPFWQAKLAENRRAKIDHRCIWKATGDLLPFVASTKPEFAGLEQHARSDHHAESRLTGSKEIQVETVSLVDLLAFHGAPAVIDYLSIDTEGSEVDILSAFDFRQYQFRLITVEHNYVEKTRAQIHDLLISHGYKREFEVLSKWDDWYCYPGLT
jgi:FkbM family methyltransferase